MIGIVRAGAVLAVALCTLAAPARADPSLFEDFSGGWLSRWTHSTQEKYGGKFVAETPEGLDGPALKVPDKAKHYGIATNLDKDVSPADGVVLQYDLKLSDGLTCGGAYLKYLTASKDFDASGLLDDTPYSVMFGPDKCGSTNKVHLIIRHQAPDGEIEEKHLKMPPSVESDDKTHVYTAVIKPDNTYEVLIDGNEKKSGSLFEDFEPPFNPPEEIDDPEDSKPDDWVDNPKMKDPDAVKPDDWDEDAPREIEDDEAEKPEGWLDDEPAEIEDPDASMPEDWDEEEDGEWEAPKIPNPKCTEGPGCGEWKRPMKPNPAYKGKWSAPMIDNPEYKGVWKPRKIPNPKYFLDETPLKNVGKIGGVGIEIWTMDQGYFFDNVLITDDAAVAADYREKYSEPKRALEEEASAKKAAEEAAKSAVEAARIPIAEKITDFVFSIFDLPFLSFLEPYVETARDFVDEHDWLPYIISGLVIGLPLLTVLNLLMGIGGKKAAGAVKQTVRVAKKQDVSEPDDKPANAVSAAVVEEEEEEEEEAAGAKATRRRTARRET